MKTKFTYDLFEYSDKVFTQTHPDLLCSVAKLYGLTAPDVENCSLLELGCGNGMNLISQAYSLPTSKFVGIDLGEKHIEYANNSKKELGLENVEFKQLDLMEINVDEFGKFDYIIAHGLFSWIPEIVRSKTLNIYQKMLNDNGVGYISYNTYPGLFYKQLGSEIAKIHTRDIDDPIEKVKKSKEFIKFLGENTKQKDVYKFILQNESFNYEQKDDIAIYHDNLAEINQPFFFYEFAKLINEYELQFISEAELLAMSTANLTPESIRILDKSKNKIQQQQNLDFLVGRSFRQSLICKKHITVSDSFDSKKLDELYIATSLKATSINPNLHINNEVKFSNLKGKSIEIDHALTKTAIQKLGKSWGNPMLFSELLKSSQTELSIKGFKTDSWEQQKQITRAIFTQLISQTDFMEYHSYLEKPITKLSDKPKVNDLASWQMTKGDLVLSKYQRAIKIDDGFIRYMLENLNGKNTLDKIIDLMKEFIEESQITNKDETLNTLEIDVKKHLEQFTNAGLFSE